MVLRQAGVTAADLDAVAYSFDPELCKPADEMGLFDPWDHLRVSYARQAPQFIASALPGLDPHRVRFVPHHIAHAASAFLASPHDRSSVLVLDGRRRAAHRADSSGVRRQPPRTTEDRRDEPARSGGQPGCRGNPGRRRR